MPVVREHAARAGVDLSTWVEKAIRDRAAQEDVLAYEEWRASWSPEDVDIEAAFEAADRAEGLGE
jgi:hypothetical protein